MSKVVIRKKDVLQAIAALVNEETAVQIGDVTVTGADIQDYVGTTLDQLAAKADKAKARAAEKREKGDELREAVQAVLTDEYQTISEIAGQIDQDDITNAKVSARLTALVKAGLAQKTQVKTADGRKINAYAKCDGEVPAEDAE